MMDDTGEHVDFKEENLNEWPSPEPRVWDRYHQELRRWNRQINLVSRFKGDSNLEGLTRDCWDAAETLPKVLALFSREWAGAFWPQVQAGDGTGDRDKDGTLSRKTNKASGNAFSDATGHATGSVASPASDHARDSGTVGLAGRESGRAVVDAPGREAGNQTASNLGNSVKVSPDDKPGDAPEFRLVYIDIGSGAGLPGIIWYLWLQEQMEMEVRSRRFTSKTTLVEPRQKRAWFLHRVKRILELNDLRVWEKRWEDCGQEGKSAGRSWSKRLWLFSLRALKMSDETVITSWQRATGMSQLGDTDRLLICRFRPASPALKPESQEDLGLPDLQITPGNRPSSVDSAWALVNCGQSVSLLASWYRKIP